jgi:uncharacterized SAM-binding protein YcdF (DUF218 family)
MRRRKISYRKLLLAGLLLPICWLLYLLTSIFYYSYQSYDGPADTAIVLGAAVANSQPTPVFEERIRQAVNLYKKGTVRYLILTGGVGGGDILAESEVARNYCLSKGIPARDIFIEKISHSTDENLEQALIILKREKLGRALIVSDPFHMRRAVTIARDYKIDAYPSPTPTSKYVGLYSQGKFLLRETYFYGRYLLGR